MRRVLAGLLVSMLPGVSAAANLEVVGPGTLTVGQIEAGACSVRLTGLIESGDADRLRALLEQVISPDYDDLGPAVCLDSPGGSLNEGVRIAEVLGSLYTASVVPEGARCLSACAVAFMAGTFGSWEEVFNVRVMHPTAQVGFHAPALSISEGVYDRGSVERAFDVAVDAIARIAGDMNVKLPESQANRFPRSLLAQMLVHRGEDYFWIDTVEKAGAWDVWLISDRRPELDKEALIRLCKASERWIEDRPKMAFQPDDWDLMAEGYVEGGGDSWRVSFGGLLTVQCDIERRDAGVLSMSLVRDGSELGRINLRSFMGFAANTVLRDLR